MKIGIYNRYWNTCGGGENYTGSLAQILSNYHEVELISVEETDWNKIQSRLRLDLSRCTMLQWPNRSCDELSCLTSNYDIFVNSTYGSSIKPLAKKSSIICYFPHKITKLARFVGFLRKIKNNVSYNKKSKSSVLVNTVNDSVILGGFELEADGRLWVSDISVLPVKSRSNGNNISFALWPESYNGLYKVSFNGIDCPFHISNSRLYVGLEKLSSQAGHLTLYCKPFIPSHNGASSDTRQLGLCFDTTKDFYSLLTANSISNVSIPDSIKSYDQVISISKFTTSWIKRRWNRNDSRELYPPIDTDSFNADVTIPREKIILSVGRFFAGGHNKKHHEMANAFIKMQSEGVIPGDWRLVMIGARHTEHANHIKYFKDLMAICNGHPIDILPDLPFSELMGFYKKASIYWHCAGWGENEDAFPERFEHFGMTTCEAMAAGCVPIVFGGAGQKEIVSHQQTGYLFKDYKNLAKWMRHSTNAHGTDSLTVMRARAQKSISRYSKEVFRETALSIFDKITASKR